MTLPDDIKNWHAEDAENRMTLDKRTLLEAAARGYCTPTNSHKELDAELLTAVVDEILRAIAAEQSSPAAQAADGQASTVKLNRSEGAADATALIDNALASVETGSPASAGPTNALDWRDAKIRRLERELAAQHYWQHEFYRVEKMVEAEQDRVEELERQLAAAKEAIEDAPHAEYCGAPSSSGAEVYECRCWKAEALSKLSADKEEK